MSKWHSQDLNPGNLVPEFLRVAVFYAEMPNQYSILNKLYVMIHRKYSMFHNRKEKGN